jgi:hypothetical protein
MSSSTIRAFLPLSAWLPQESLFGAHGLGDQARQGALDGVDVRLAVGVAVQEYRRRPLEPVLGQVLRHVQRGRVRQVRIQHHALRRAALEGRDRIGAGGDRRDPQIGPAQQGHELLAPRRAGLHDQQLARGLVGVALDRRHRLLERLAGREWFRDDDPRPQPEAAVGVVIGRDDVDRDVARGHVVLDAFEHPVAVDVQQRDVERDRRRPELLAQAQGRGAERGDHALEALRARFVEEGTRERRVVLDDE